ncbi:MAG: 2-dehydropantoate 2-reductase [Desulfobulbaceae bacterium]|jgi:2-dehydropantoate 2-reductase|nr:2-dehydropantoate 2-reductase [Desulfobulbaceae bacterium]MDY0351399.1 2-dehydropantoate 2-reductase [Desulfobulbaceae bacterium]
MRMVIVGPGALGSLLAARISLHLQQQEDSAAGNDIRLHLLDYRPERAQYLARHGLILEDGSRRFHAFPSVTAAPAICRTADILFLCVKTTALDEALNGMRPFLGPDQVLMAMQNGIGHLEKLAGLPCIAGAGVTSEGATLIAPGHVRHGGAGLTRLGLLDRRRPPAGGVLERTAALFNGAGMATELSDDPLPHIWTKLLINVGINALTAVHRCPNGALLEAAALRDTMEKAVLEAARVARAANIPIAGDPVADTAAVCKATGNNISSMLQDVRNHRRTEIDAINGAIVAEGERLGIATPVNRELVRLVREIEAGYPGRQELEERT